jgi:glycosyltransferase involved in cell wall biosynthesis
MSVPKPRLLIVGRTRYRLPLNESLERKFRALEDELQVRVLGSAQADSETATPRFRLVRRKRPAFLDGALFYLTLPALVARELRTFRPHAVITQSVYEGAAVLLAKWAVRSKARVIVDVHGDWDTATELYGSRKRRLLAPVTRRVSRFSVRRADAVRTISEFTSKRVRREGIEPASVFPAYVDFATFLETPPAHLPPSPRALFVGVLERYKNVDGLADAWRLVVQRLPDARLLVVGTGRERETIERLVTELPDQTVWESRLAPEDVARVLDESTLLVLPSRSEGLPRIVIEAFCRGRPVVGTRTGGIPDIVEDGVNGVLVPSEDPEALAEVLVRVLSDHELQEQLAEGALASAAEWLQTPEEYAAHVRDLVARVAGV